MLIMMILYKLLSLAIFSGLILLIVGLVLHDIRDHERRRTL